MAVVRQPVYYFAYGSNLHPVRLGERVPSASLLGAVQLNRYRLKFHKKSTDGSAKCNLLKTGNRADTVHGALYTLEAEHKQELDRFEGAGKGYQDSLINIHHEQKHYPCFTYLAEDSHIENNLQPYHWYKNLVVFGAMYLKFPSAYITRLEAVKSIQDSNVVRRLEMETLLEKIISYR